MIRNESKAILEIKYHWLGLFPSRQALLNCITFYSGIFPRIILLKFVAMDVYALPPTGAPLAGRTAEAES